MEEPWTRTGSAESHWEVTEASTRLGLIFCFQMFQGQNLADQAGFFGWHILMDDKGRGWHGFSGPGEQFQNVPNPQILVI